MKKLISIFFVMICIQFSGCKWEDTDGMNFETNIVIQTNTNYSAFNDETYIWENFIFTTNRVNEVK